MEKEKSFWNNIVLVIDFDATITKNDLAYELLDEYGRPNWREIENEIRDGKITLREGIQRELGNLAISPKTLTDFAKKRTVLDEGAKTLFQWARERRVPCYVLSDGIAQYIEVVFQHFLDISLDNKSTDEWRPQLIANRFKWKNGTQVERVVFPNPPCDYGCANCKPFWMKQIKNTHPDAKIIFIGDGYTDRLAAPHADLIFARKGELLEQILKTQQVPHFSYETLRDVVNIITSLLK